MKSQYSLTDTTAVGDAPIQHAHLREGSFSRLDDLINYRLLQARRLFLCEAVGEQSMERLIRELWFLQLNDSNAPITLFINSPGGSVDAGMALWDQFKATSCPIYTVVTGLAASMGSVLSLLGGKGRRLATANARIMIHQPSISGVIRGQASDLEIQAQEIIRTRTKLVQLYVEATGRSAEAIERALDRDRWMSAQEAKEFGLIDEVIDQLPAHL